MSKLVERCTYCGEPAKEKDVVIPDTRVGLAATGRRHKCVPACSECAHLLGAYPRYCVQERARRIAVRLEKKYRPSTRRRFSYAVESRIEARIGWATLLASTYGEELLREIEPARRCLYERHTAPTGA